MLQKADLEYLNFEYPAAAADFESYLTTAENDSAALAKLADCYWLANEHDRAFRVYKRLFAKGNHGATEEQQLRIAEMYARVHDYKQASQWLSGIEGYQSKASSYQDELTLKYMKRDSLNWHVGFLAMNTSFDEFSPFINDGTFYYISNKPNLRQKHFFDDDGIQHFRLWKMSDQFMNKEPETKNIDANTAHSHPENIYAVGDTSKAGSLVKEMEKIQYNVGTTSIDQHHHFYFCANYSIPDKKQINRLHVLEAFSTGFGSVKITDLPFGDSKSYSVMHPAVNRDGTLLVLSSDKPHGKGNYDLYYTQRASVDQPWDSLKTFCSNINTVGNEVFPTITLNGYLYFSSDALPGLGGLDIFRIPLESALNGKGKPEHLSYPVNSSGDDFGWTQDTTALHGYFTSDRMNYNNDIYSFNYKEPVKMSSFENQVLNRKTGMPMEGATLFLLNKQDGKVYIGKTDKQGKSRFEVPQTGNVIVKAMKNGFSNYCIPVNAIEISKLTDSVVIASQNFSLAELKINYTWKLNIIHYAFDKSDLCHETKTTLDSLINILKTYPITAEISSHTDSRGPQWYNYWLSQRRSESVVNYLVDHGIDRIRLRAKGYGKSKLINRCVDGVSCSEKEQRINRRTEVKLVDVDIDPKSAAVEFNPDQYKTGDVINKKALPLGFFDECDPSASQR